LDDRLTVVEHQPIVSTLNELVVGYLLASAPGLDGQLGRAFGRQAQSRSWPRKGHTERPYNVKALEAGHAFPGVLRFSQRLNQA